MFKYKGADKKFKLNADNYFTQEASEHYMSIHPFINFIGTPYITACGGRVLHELEESTEPNDAMLIGSYVDSYYEGTLDKFKSDNPQLLKKDGSLYQKYEICDLMIERAENDKLFKQYMTGIKQKIYTGSFGGLDWKIKVDNLILDKNENIIGLVDLKTVRDIHGKIDGYNFIEAYGYDYQLALYREILRQNIDKVVPCYICAVSKEDTPETAVIYVDSEDLDTKLETIKNHCDDFKKLITRESEPELCGTCAYCKSIRVNDKVINYKDL